MVIIAILLAGRLFPDETKEIPVEEPKSEYIEIDGEQSFSYVSREIVSGSVSDYYPYKNREYNLDLTIRGKLADDVTIEGYVKNDSRIETSDYINIKAYGRDWECEAGNSENIGYDDTYKNSKIITMKGRYSVEKWDANAGVGMPQGEYYREYFKGDNTQGPYQLANIPVIQMTEKITLMDNTGERELLNGKDYTIDYRLGKIKMNEILRDDQRIEVEYYKESVLGMSRVDYTINGNLKTKYVYGGIGAGGVYTRADTLTDSLTEDYYVLSGKLGAKIDDRNYAETVCMTNIQDKDDGYNFTGNGIMARAGIRAGVLKASGDMYKKIGDFKRIGEVENIENTVINTLVEVNLTELSSISAEYNRKYDDTSNDRSIKAGANVNLNRFGAIDYMHTDNYSIMNTGDNTKYKGNGIRYENEFKKNEFYLQGDIGKRETLSDTVYGEYQTEKIEFNDKYGVNDRINISGGANGECREYADGDKYNYGVNAAMQIKTGESFNANLTGNYLYTEDASIYTVSGNTGWKFKNYIKMNSKINTEVNRRYLTDDTISEREIKYNISNVINSTPFQNVNLGLNSNIILSEGLESGFMYQRNYVNGGFASIGTKAGQITLEAGNGKYVNYSNTIENNLLSDNVRYYINTTLIPKKIGDYTVRLTEKYAYNNGLTMSYIPISYTDEVDTVSNEVNQRDLELGLNAGRVFNVGRVNAGYDYIYNIKTIPDSIPVDAYSHKGYMDLRRSIFSGLDITGRFTLEKRIGIDPDIERTEDKMNVLIVTPEAGIYYSLSGYGNAGAVYSTSYYSGTSSQNRQKIGLNVNLARGYFEVSASCNYQISRYYKILEYEFGLKVKL
ncbi:MAG: hypothetical protein AB7T10_06870 [bacterium]